MLTKTGLPGFFPEDFRAAPELVAALGRDGDSREAQRAEWDPSKHPRGKGGKWAKKADALEHLADVQDTRGSEGRYSAASLRAAANSLRAGQLDAAEIHMATAEGHARAIEGGKARKTYHDIAAHHAEIRKHQHGGQRHGRGADLISQALTAGALGQGSTSYAPQMTLGGIGSVFGKKLSHKEALAALNMLGAIRALEEGVSAWRFDPHELRDPHSGEWARGGVGPLGFTSTGAGTDYTGGLGGALPSSPAKTHPALPWHLTGNTVHYHGSLGLPREQVPQLSGTINGEYHGPDKVIPQFTSWLRGHGVAVERKRVDPRTLKPVKDKGSYQVVRGLADEILSGQRKPDWKPVFVSSDGYVLDGTQTWAAKMLSDHEGGPKPGIAVVQADAPLERLLPLGASFMSEIGMPYRKAGEEADPRYAGQHAAVRGLGWAEDELLLVRYDPHEPRDPHSGKWARRPGLPGGVGRPARGHRPVGHTGHPGAKRRPGARPGAASRPIGFTGIPTNRNPRRRPGPSQPIGFTGIPTSQQRREEMRMPSVGDLTDMVNGLRAEFAKQSEQMAAEHKAELEQVQRDLLAEHQKMLALTRREDLAEELDDKKRHALVRSVAAVLGLVAVGLLIIATAGMALPPIAAAGVAVGPLIGGEAITAIHEAYQRRQSRERIVSTTAPVT